MLVPVTEIETTQWTGAGLEPPAMEAFTNPGRWLLREAMRDSGPPIVRRQRMPPLSIAPTDSKSADAVPGPKHPPHRRIFISYVHEDWQQVDRLVRSLRRREFDVWLDR